MFTISLCMIVKNEEEVLARCLSSVQEAVDEIIITDTGSTDRTKKIAKQFNAKVYDFKWINDFAAARNFCFNKATSQYILWLDADDVLMPKDLQKLIELKQTTPFDYNTVTMNYHLSFDQNGNPTFSYRRNRLVKRELNFKWIGAVHEYLEVYGPALHSDIAVTHRKNKDSSDRNLNIYLARLEAGDDFNPRDQYYFANELKDHGRYEQAIKWYNKFLNGKKGWVEDNINACYRMASCYEALQDIDLAIKSILRALQYDRPRPDFCCQLASYFFTQGRYNEAAYWYATAIETKDNNTDMSFHNPATATWLPHLQLTVCYDRLKQPELALKHHRLAAQFNPNHPSIIYNEKYFKSIGLIKDEDDSNEEQPKQLELKEQSAEVEQEVKEEVNQEDKAVERNTGKTKAKAK